MKVYQCDNCKRIITDPYETKMKEFFMGYDYDFGTSFYEPFKRKVKIHLCEDCFNGLRFIAEQKEQRSNKNV